MADWHVLRSPDGRYAARAWEIFNTALRRPRSAMAPDLNRNELAVSVNVYTSFMDAIEDSVRYNDVLGEVLFPAPVEFHGAGPGAIMTERGPWA